MNLLFSIQSSLTHFHHFQFVSLVNPSISVDCAILRDCYESFAMYCFGRYLVACLGGEDRTLDFMEKEGRATFKTPLLRHYHSSHSPGIVKHPFPIKYFLKPWILGPRFYQIVKFGIVQYVRILSIYLFSSFSFFSFFLSFKSFLQLIQMIIKSFTAILAVILEAFGVYCEGEFKLGCG